jgi:oligopeptidase B
MKLNFNLTVSAIVLSMSLIACSEAPSKPSPESEQSPASANSKAPNTTIESDNMKQTTRITPPVAKKVPHKMVTHGHERIDPYYWMRDDKREDPEIIAHLEAENAYTKQEMLHTEAFQQKLFDELTNRVEKDVDSVPYLDDGLWYSYRYQGDQEYKVHLIREDAEQATEQVLIDENVMAKGLDYFSLGDYELSANKQLLAYSTDTVSRRMYTIQIRDMQTGKLLSDKIEQTSGNIVWANDNQTLFYIKKDPVTLLGYQVYRHKVGTPSADDVLVYEEKDNTFYTFISKTKDNDYLLINHYQTITSGISLLDANSPNETFQPFTNLEEGHEYGIDKIGDTFYIMTNWKAKNFRLMKVHQDKTSDRNAWQEVIPHRADTMLENVEVFNDYIVIEERTMGQERVRVIGLKDQSDRYIEFNDPVYAVYLQNNAQMDATKLRLGYSSPTTPNTQLDVDLKSFDKTLLKQTKVLGDFDSNNYAAERILVAARDGAKVPVTLAYRKDKFNKDGSNPIYQYAYGSYGSTVNPHFSSSALSLMDRGFVYAISHIRGGQMLGRAWYDDGKMLNKKNTFTDFVDVTKGLVEQKYGAKDKVFAVGGSAGGLLMGAIINMQPELYRGVGAHVPFVDVVTTMLDESIPLTTNEYDEWGNPNQKTYYEYMLSYSPYDQVTKQDYPNLLVTTGLHDSQVQYFEPMKWVAKLRDMKTNDNKLLFDVNMEAGHGGASGRFRRNRDRALEYAFFFDLLGIKQ